MRLSGAEILARTLIEQGVDTVFGYPGGSVLPIYDALSLHSNKITHYLTAHEQGAAHAADGYARATGKVGVVLTTSGPGATNIVTGIACAFMDSIPLVAITGNVGTSYIGKDSFQEVYTTGITLPITKHNYAVQDVRELAGVLREAFKLALAGRPGPVLIDITKDAQAAWCEWKPMETATVSAKDSSASCSSTDCLPSLPVRALKEPPPVSQEVIAALNKRIKMSKKPLVVFGGGIILADASVELTSFLQTAQIPACHSLMGIGALAPDNPLNLGLLGMHGKASANHALAEADLVLALGFRFSDRVVLNPNSWASQAQIVQVDIDQSEVDKNLVVDLAICADVRDLLAKIGQSTIGNCNTTSWLTQINEWRKDDYLPQDNNNVLKPHQVFETIAQLVGEDALFTTDVGQHQMWAAQYGCREKPRTFITSGGLGAMGFGYGAAIGAQIGVGGGGGKRTRAVIHITGDGSFHMNLNEACTAVTYRLPIITIIFNNHALGMVRQWQKAFYDARYYASTPERVTDYSKVAEGFGLQGMRATTLAEFRAALTVALKVNAPFWIECLIDPDEQVLPLIPTGGTVEDTITQ